MSQAVRTCMISLFIGGGACLSVYGYYLLETAVYSLTNATYSATNFPGTDAFSEDMQSTTYSIDLPNQH